MLTQISVIPFALALTLFQRPVWAESGDNFKATQAAYLQKCGGKIYSKCDEKDMNQKTLFQLAVEAAAINHNNVFLILGADWCPACEMLHSNLSTHPEAVERIERRYVIVELNADVSSTREVQKSLGINVYGVPVGVIYDPSQQKTIAAFYPNSMSIGELTAYLEKQGAAQTTAQSDSSLIGKVRTAILEKPIEHRAGFGPSQYVPSTQLIGADKEKFIQYVRDGMLYLHSFFWINASRSFNMALALEPSNPIVLSLKALATAEIEGSSNNGVVSYELIKAAKANSSFPLDAEDKAFADYVYSAVCKTRFDACNDADLINKSWYDLADESAKKIHEKMDFLALLGYRNQDVTMLESILAKEPENPGAHHYLIHLYEPRGKIDLAGQHAREFARLAPNSPHAQHMYGHILPQLGKWEEALVQFQRANELHQEEFKLDGISPAEDWHYSHNIDLLASTLVYLGKYQEAGALLKTACETNFENCPMKIQLMILNGESTEAEVQYQENYSSYLNVSYFADNRILNFIAAGNFKKAAEILEVLKKTKALDADSMIFSILAVAAVINKGSEEALNPFIAALETRLQQPGFDRWSKGVLSSRILAYALRKNGLDNLAAKIDEIAIGNHALSMCGSQAPKCTTPKSE